MPDIPRTLLKRGRPNGDSQEFHESCRAVRSNCGTACILMFCKKQFSPVSFLFCQLQSTNYRHKEKNTKSLFTSRNTRRFSISTHWDLALADRRSLTLSASVRSLCLWCSVSTNTDGPSRSLTAMGRSRFRR